MNEIKYSPDQNIAITIPIRIGYNVLEVFLRKKFVNEVISKETVDGKSSNYAKILNISLDKSNIPGFDLAITIQLQTLTFLYRDRELDIVIHVTLDFDAENQKISIQKYEIDSKGKSWLADQLLESTMNRFMYQKVKDKLNFDLMPAIKEQLDSLNIKLANKLEASQGIFVMGSMEKLQISYLQARDNDLWIFMSLQGWGVVEIDNIQF